MVKYKKYGTHTRASTSLAKLLGLALAAILIDLLEEV